MPETVRRGAVTAASRMRRARRGTTVLLTIALLSACSTTVAQPPGTGAPPATSDGGDDVALPVRDGADLDGLIAVRGHRLAVRCTGSGHPTVVVLHGDIEEPGVTSASYYGPLTAAVRPDLRICSYDRANVGGSDVVAGTQTPEMVVGDLDGLMTALGETGPLVLVGQSQGGMVASAYAVAHPSKVAGIVMIDASFDDEITIEGPGKLPGVGPCDPANRKADATESLQKIDDCAMYQWAYARRDRRPKVPLDYLAAKRAPWSGYTDFSASWRQAIAPLQKSYAASWSPGRFEWIDSGHEIHQERPEAVAAAIRWVVAHRS